MGKHLLLVDDDRAFTAVASVMLRNSGIDVTIVHTAAEALTAFQSQTFDVIVSDLLLPGVDGIALAQKLQADVSDSRVLPLLLAVSNHDRHLHQLALDSGYQACFDKIDFDRLLRYLQER